MEGAFVTATCVHLDSGGRRLAYANAGHPPGLLWRAGAQSLERLDRSGLLLGVVPEAAYETVVLSITPGDRVLLYTDGLVEASNAADDHFDEGRLCRLVAESSHLLADALADSLLREVREWTGRPAFEDDLTLLVLSVR